MFNNSKSVFPGELAISFQRSSQTPGPIVKFEFGGRHLLASYLECDLAALNDLPGLLKALEEAVAASHATLIQLVDHVFPGKGITAVVLLSESHASIHTYPEHAACFVDIFTCGQRCSPENFDKVLRQFLRPGKVACNMIVRGEENCDESVLKKASELPLSSVISTVQMGK